MSEVILSTGLRGKGVKPFKKGKVRDIYYLGDYLLFIATDRISAFDCILPDGIPDKGKVLTGISEFWFDYTHDICPNHMVTTDVSEFPEVLQQYEWLQGRSMLVKKVERIDIECVVRGYLAGSAWKEYQASGQVSGIKLPSGLCGLRESERLPELIFSPVTKAPNGEHDMNITIRQMENLVGKNLTKLLIDYSLSVFVAASERVESVGLILAHAKFEFGIQTGRPILIDEALTPDSSSFWLMDDYEPGRPQKSFDKYVRDYLESIGWDKQLPIPQLPDEVIRQTSEKYLEAYRRIVCGKDLAV